MGKKYIKCPRCELNYILENEDYCHVCKSEMKHHTDADDELLDLFDVPRVILPKVVNTCGYRIKVEEERITKGKELHITSIVADQQSSLFGQGCINKGDIKNTYGTGSFILSNTGSDVINSSSLIWK